MKNESQRLRQDILDLKNLTQAVRQRNMKLKMELEKMKEEANRPFLLPSTLS